MELSERISTIIEAGFIPVLVEIFDRETETKIEEYLVACYAVPRVSEIVEYNGEPLEVFSGSHKFESIHVIRNTKVPVQVVTIATWRA